MLAPKTALLLAAIVLQSGSLLGCASHAETTKPVRTALDAGQPERAVQLLSQQAGVASGKDLPGDLQGDKALLVLDRATVQQSLAAFALSQRDYEAADKAIDVLDLASGAGDTLATYMFSGSSARYRAPPYEKLLLNTFNLLNYLETGDSSGARVEARRIAVTQTFFKNAGLGDKSPALPLAGFLAGLAFESAGEVDEALRFYDDALSVASFPALRASAVPLLAGSTYRSPHLAAAAAGFDGPKLGPEEGEIVVVVGYGRVPFKIAKRVPIGLALTLHASSISPENRAAANRLAAQGLVTWVNYPTLGRDQGGWEIPRLGVDGYAVRLDEAVDVTGAVQQEWERIEGKIVAAAITRMITRAAAGAGVGAAAGRNNGVIGVLASLAVQGVGVALDVPDTRGWETLPARVAVQRMHVAKGTHRLVFSARGATREVTVEVKSGEISVVSFLALR